MAVPVACSRMCNGNRLLGQSGSGTGETPQYADVEPLLQPATSVLDRILPVFGMKYKLIGSSQTTQYGQSCNARQAWRRGASPKGIYLPVRTRDAANNNGSRRAFFRGTCPP